MGGIGLLMLCLLGAFKIAGSIDSAVKDNQTMRDTNNGLTYRKYSSQEYYSSATGRPCYWGFVYTYCDGSWKYPQDKLDGAQKGDYVLRDRKTNRIIYNQTKERRDAKEKVIVGDLKELEDAIAIWEARERK